MDRCVILLGLVFLSYFEYSFTQVRKNAEILTCQETDLMELKYKIGVFRFANSLIHNFGSLKFKLVSLQRSQMFFQHLILKAV